MTRLRFEGSHGATKYDIRTETPRKERGDETYLQQNIDVPSRDGIVRIGLDGPLLLRQGHIQFGDNLLSIWRSLDI